MGRNFLVKLNQNLSKKTSINVYYYNLSEVMVTAMRLLVPLNNEQ